MEVQMGSDSLGKREAHDDLSKRDTLGARDR